MNYDVTFCSNLNCDKPCMRNQKNVDKKEVALRKGIWVGDFPNCKYFKDWETKEN